MFPESNDPHDGAFDEVTVCAAESSLVKVTVLLIPTTRVMRSGAYPGAPEELPAPLVMETGIGEPPVEEELVEQELELGEVEEEVM
jgi:hypothetical protein